MMGSMHPKRVTAPDLICDNLNGSARVATLMFKDSAKGSHAGGALALMKTMKANAARAAMMGCPLVRSTSDVSQNICLCHDLFELIKDARSFLSYFKVKGDDPENVTKRAIRYIGVRVICG